MFKLIGGLLKFVFMLILLLVVVAGSLLAMATSYFAPEPAEYEFAAEVDGITSVQIVNAKLIEGGVDTEVICEIDDVDAFLADFGALECNKGLSLTSLAKISELESMEAILITYSDGTFEVISAYGNINSGLELSKEALLQQQIFIFDEAEFSALLAKYKA